jgi:hypothetical protein
MSVRTVNTGRATWLANAEGLRGRGYLGWRWLNELKSSLGKLMEKETIAFSAKLRILWRFC